MSCDKKQRIRKMKDNSSQILLRIRTRIRMKDYHVMLVAWMFLTLSYHLSLSTITLVKSFKQHPVSTELMKVSFCWLTNTGLSMYKSIEENIVYEFVLTSPAVPSMSCSSYLDGEMGGKWPYICGFCKVLLLEFVQNST